MDMQLKYTNLLYNQEIVYISLKRAPVNFLNPVFMEELDQIYSILYNDNTIKFVVLQSECEKFFSNGIDIEHLLSGGVELKTNTFMQFFALINKIYLCPKIQYAIINGNAMAGGAVLASVMDYRILSNEKYRFSFNEVKLGLPLPLSLTRIVESIIGSQNIKQALYEGEAYKPEEARHIGLADILCEKNLLTSQLQRHIKKISRLSFNAYIKSKLEFRNYIISSSKRENEQFLLDLPSFFNTNFDNSLRYIQNKMA